MQLRKQRELLHEAISLYQPPPSTQPTEPTSSSSNDYTASTSDVWQFFDEQVHDIASRQTPTSSVLPEIDQYLKAPLLARSENPLQWWKENKNNYHNIFKVVCKYLCTVATSVPSERLFSKAGELISQKRSRLKAENVDMILFLNSSELC
jgi:hypothetical protein